MNDCKFCGGEFLPAYGCGTEGPVPARLVLRFGADFTYGVRHDWDGDGHWLMFDNSCGEYAEGGILISYCPFCGKRLESG